MSDKVFYTDYLEDFYSTNLESLHYDRDTSTLIVGFLSGSLIGYRDVPLYIWNNLVAASSKGSYYNSHVKGMYHGLGRDITYDDLVLREDKVAPAVEAVKGATTFVIHGTKTEFVEQTVIALNLPEAIAKFIGDNPNTKVTEVTIKIV